MRKYLEFPKVLVGLAMAVLGLYLLATCTNSCSVPKQVAIEETMNRLEAENGNIEFAPETKCIDHEEVEIDQRDGSTMPKIYIVGAC